MKKLVVSLLVSLSLASSSFAETNAIQDVGKGMIVGGIGSASGLGGAVAVIGSIIDVIGGSVGTTKIDMNDPKAKAKFIEGCNKAAKIYMSLKYKELLKPSPTTTADQIKSAAIAYCTDIDSKIATNGGFEIHRSLVAVFVGPEGLPKSDSGNKTMFLKIPSNPYPDCVGTLSSNGERLVAKVKP